MSFAVLKCSASQFCKHITYPTSPFFLLALANLYFSMLAISGTSNDLTKRVGVKHPNYLHLHKLFCCQQAIPTSTISKQASERIFTNPVQQPRIEAVQNIYCNKPASGLMGFISACLKNEVQSFQPGRGKSLPDHLSPSLPPLSHFMVLPNSLNIHCEFYAFPPFGRGQAVDDSCNHGRDQMK